MIPPVCCFTCGKVLADKWEEYLRRCSAIQEERLEAKGDDGMTERGRILSRLGITKICCRVVMITTVDLSAVI